MSINASTARDFRELGERLTAAAQRIDAGEPIREVDPLMDLARAVGATIASKPTYEARLAAILYEDYENAAKEHPLGGLILEVLTLGKSWTGSISELSEIGEALGRTTRVDPQMFAVRHWFSRGISAAGALAHISGDDTIHLARHQWFSFAGRTKPTLPLDSEDAPRPVRHLLRGSWASLGIDPDLCIYCLEAPFQEIEHFVPKSRGGSNDISNLFPACIACNRGRGTGKHDKDPWEWLAKVHPIRLAYFQKLFGIKPNDN